MIEINIEGLQKKLQGKNAKYIVLVGIGLMILIAASNFGSSAGVEKSGGEEARLEQMLNMIEGIDEASVMINRNNNKAEGVIIVAKGAENAAIKKVIHDAAAAALGVNANKIEVFSKKGGE